MNTENLNEEIDTDSLFDELDFKPITEGLGFHHSIKEKKEVQLSLNSKKKELEKDLFNRADRLKESHSSQGDSSLMDPARMGELAPFYAPLDKEELDLNVSLSSDESISNSDFSVVDKAAGPELRFAAWFLDLMILMTIMSVTVSAIIVFADLPLDILNRFMISNDLVLSFGSMFGMFYLFYFSFFDKTLFSTPGKRILGIRLMALSGDLKISQSFSRAVLTLLSISTLGLLSLLKIQDRLTDTNVVKK